MSLLLDALYLLLIAALSPWLVWAAYRKGKYREGYGAKFFGHVPCRSGDAPCIWFHAVSVGEVNLLQTLLERIAEEYRSEGAGEAARIIGNKDRDLQEITSEAYRQAQEIKGRADAEAADIYARAYNRDPDFYRFLKTMEVYTKTMDKETILLLSTDGEFLRYMERDR